jgi:hypothetical protein
MPDVIKILEPKDQDDNNIVPHVASNIQQEAQEQQ